MAPSMGAAARQTSVLWCATQPRAPYMALATFAPLRARSCVMRNSGSTHSPSAVGPAGQ
jgi:hypothetical protein